MENLEIHESSHSIEDSSEDIGTALLSRFSNSSKEEHQHLCAAVGAMAQELKDQKLPLTPLAYFGLTIATLNRLVAESKPADPVTTALLTFLSITLPKVSPPILRKKRSFVSEPTVQVLRSESAEVGAVVAGLKCVSHLLVVGEKVSWSDISPLYGLLLSFITDSRTKVRKQSHVCLRDVLQSFQRTAVLVHASEGITTMFQRFLLLAGGSNPTESGKPKGAEEVLRILDALKDCLPLMPTNAVTSCLKYFESLLKLRQSFVTRRITDSLHVLCLNPTSEVDPETLRNLLCSLAKSVSQNERSVDSMTFAARLLDVGIRKVYSLNRDICVARLPIVFHALEEIMACEHEEAVFSATEAFRSLIFSCIDGGLIKQESEHTRDYEDGDTGQSGTIIEILCATVERLLKYRYNAVWDMSLKVVSAMFEKLGEMSYQLLRGAVESLADMQKMPDEALQCRKQLHECFGSVLGAMGPKYFLTLLPLNLEAQDPYESSWLFSILKQYTVGASLSFFRKSILGKVEVIRKKARKLEQEGQIYSSRGADALVYSLWALLPAFCNYAVDTSSSFKDLRKELCDALRDESEVRGVVCSSLQILIQQNRRVLEDDGVHEDMGIPLQKARAKYTHQVAADNLATLRSSAREVLSVLSAIFMKSPNDSGGCLQSTIREFALISDKEVVKGLFERTMVKLLKVTQEAVKSVQPNAMKIEYSANEISPVIARARLLDLAASLLPGLDAKQVDVLFSAIKPALQDDEGLVQKKAYKILSYILKDLHEFLSANLDDLLQMMTEVLPSCHFSAKRHRIDCLYFIIVYISKDASERSRQDIIGSFLTEIILALKEANKKTRNKAFDILVQIGHAIGDEEQGGKKENLLHYFNMVAGGLAGETPHMISAAIKGLARLAYEFSDLVSAAYNVLPSAFLLLQRKNREIIKANLGLLKVLVAKSQAGELQEHLKNLVEGLLKWQDDTKNHFKAKVKHLLEMLVTKCGLDAVKAVMPEEHMKLLTNIRKIKARKERKRTGDSELETRSGHSKATTSRMSRWNHTKVFSDFGDEDSEDDGYMEAKSSSRFNSKTSTLRSKRTHRAAAVTKSLPEDLIDQMDEDPLDFLDQQKVRMALQSSDKQLKRKHEESEDDELETDADGRLIIREGGRPKREKSSADSNTDTKSQAGRSRMSSKSLKKRKTSASGWAYTGNEYASKKASGDVTRKDKLEPYAYWPLDRKMMSRRPEHRAAARKGMASVVRMTKKLQGRSVSSALSIHGGLKSKKKHKGKKNSARG